MNYKRLLNQLKINSSQTYCIIFFGGLIAYGLYHGFSKNKSQIIPPVDKKIKDDENETTPKQSETLNLIYNQTVRARDVPDEFKQFVGVEQDINFVLEEYCTNFSDQAKQEVKKHLKGMRRARGDGNCFYTSFCFQYLGYIFNKASDQEFQDFINMVRTLPFSVIHDNLEYQQNDEMSISFQKFCKIIRSTDIQNRNQKFFDLFSDSEGQFYGLSIIFLRNLTYKFCEEDEETKIIFQALELDLKQQILTWEYDCENNQSVINLLSHKLSIDIILFFIDEDNYQLQIQEYIQKNQQAFLKIHFIFRPGHYNIALINDNQRSI